MAEKKITWNSGGGELVVSASEFSGSRGLTIGSGANTGAARSQDIVLRSTTDPNKTCIVHVEQEELGGPVVKFDVAPPNARVFMLINGAGDYRSGASVPFVAEDFLGFRNETGEIVKIDILDEYGSGYDSGYLKVGETEERYMSLLENDYTIDASVISALVPVVISNETDDVCSITCTPYGEEEEGGAEIEAGDTTTIDCTAFTRLVIDNMRGWHCRAYYEDDSNNPLYDGLTSPFGTTITSRLDPSRTLYIDFA